MLTKEEIMAVLEQALADTQRNAPVRHPFSADLILLGREGVLDSLDAMLFLDEVDEALSAKTGKRIVVVSDDALSREPSPFHSMQTLADYVDELLSREAS